MIGRRCRAFAKPRHTEGNRTTGLKPQSIYGNDGHDDDDDDGGDDDDVVMGAHWGPNGVWEGPGGREAPPERWWSPFVGFGRGTLVSNSFRF